MPRTKPKRPPRSSSSSSSSSNGGASGDLCKLPYSQWLSSYAAVSEWFKAYDIEQLLDQGGGIARILNFLPPQVALGAHQCLSRIGEQYWHTTASDKDYGKNNIEHMFLSTKQAPGLDKLLRIFTAWQPDRLATFSAAKYTHSHHIEPHDDCAFTNVLLDSGSTIECSRDIAVIVYLTPDWIEQYGGILRDLDGKQHLTPVFNSAVVFRVPRMHEVTAVLTKLHTRYSLFGWYLQPGQLYDLTRRKRFSDLLIDSLTVTMGDSAHQQHEQYQQEHDHDHNQQQQQLESDGGQHMIESERTTRHHRPTTATHRRNKHRARAFEKFEALRFAWHEQRNRRYNPMA
jgi:hypothetical protein